MRRLQHHHSGFTIIELVVVITVIGVLAAITVVGYGAWRAQTAQNAVKSDLNALAGAMENARNFGSGYPSSIPSSFTASDNVQEVTLTTSLSGDYYCASAASAQDAAVIFHLSSENNTLVSGACADYSGVAVKKGLVGWWKLNSNTNDSSGNGLNGSPTNVTMSLGQNGQSDGAYTFGGNGTTSVISLPVSTLLNGAVFTMSAWIKPENAIAGTIIGSATNDSGPQFRFSSGASSRALELLKQNIASMGSSTTLVPLSTWTFVTVTYNSSGQFVYYINGVASGSGTSLQTFTFSNYQIGRKYTTTASEVFNGSIDDVRIYNRVLSQSDMSTLYTAGAQ